MACSSVSIVNFEHVIISWEDKNVKEMLFNPLMHNVLKWSDTL